MNKIKNKILINPQNEQFLKDIQFLSGSPIYRQLATLLEDAIHKNIFHTGFIPPERELASLLNISRVTVSKALDFLEEKKLIYRQQGLGTKINLHIAYSLNQLVGFTERMVGRGYQVSNQWLVRDKRCVTQEIAHRLRLPERTVTAYIQRIRLLDGCPVSIESTYIPLNFLPDPEVLTDSLYDYWRQQGIYPLKKKFSINAVTCNKKTALLLNKPENTPLLKIQEISSNEQSEALEFSETLCLGDYYAFEFEI